VTVQARDQDPSTEEADLYDIEESGQDQATGRAGPRGVPGVRGVRRGRVRRRGHPAQVQELIAVAVAQTTQCPYCIAVHSENELAIAYSGCLAVQIVVHYRSVSPAQLASSSG